MRCSGQYDLRTAVACLGNGSRIVADDTVPICLWFIARHPEEFVSAMWDAVEAEGDRDTTCAIIGGILACRPGGDTGAPADWIQRRVPLQFDVDRLE